MDTRRIASAIFELITRWMPAAASIGDSPRRAPNRSTARCDASGSIAKTPPAKYSGLRSRTTTLAAVTDAAGASPSLLHDLHPTVKPDFPELNPELCEVALDDRSEIGVEGGDDCAFVLAEHWVDLSRDRNRDRAVRAADEVAHA